MIIKLSNSDIPCIIDDEDYKLIMSHTTNWFLQSDRWSGQSIRGFSKLNNTNILIARLILNIQEHHIYADHIDNNIFNNRRSNLRQVTSSQSAMNRRKIKIPCSSKFKGVSKLKDERPKPWRARIKVKGEVLRCQFFETELEAATMYDLWSKEFHKKYCNNNNLI